MSSHHVDDLLPLWIEGDLDVRESRAVEAHLAECGHCRAEAAALRGSQAWLKSATLPFGAEDREELRQAVLARIQASKGRASKAWWIAPLAAAALLVVFLRPHREAVVEALPPAPPMTAPRSFPVIPVTKPLRAARRQAIPPPLESAAGPGASRIEIQTSNPQIRIIWLARATVPSDGSLHSTQEDL
jgi:anti-sigma factor RsiW